MICSPSRSGRIDGQLLLGGQSLDPRLEVVIGPLEPLGLAPVASGAVGPGQHVQSLEQGRRRGHSGGPRSRSTRRSRSRGSADAARPVERHGVDVVVGEPQRLHPLLGHLRADDIVVVEGHRAVLVEPARARLADVVQQRGQPGDQVRTALGEPRPRARWPARRTVKRVLVDVLVAMMLVALQPQRGQLRQHQLGDPGLHEQRQTRPVAAATAPAWRARRGSVRRR